MCTCRTPPFRHSDYDRTHVGEDPRGVELSIDTCKSCGTRWLECLIEQPQYTASGRWWRVELPPGREVSPDEARAFVEAQKDGFAGGSYFNSTGFAVSAPIHVY